MSNRRKLIVANWKMNGRLTSGLMLAREISEKALAAKPLPYDIVLCPPYTLLWPVAETLMGTPVFLGAQNCNAANHGAYTGEVSAGMLADLGCRYVILGHSERRVQHNENDETIQKKINAAQLAGLTVILCVGETVEQRSAGLAEKVVAKQVKNALLQDFNAAQLVVAYEPIWAIGTGEQPEMADIQLIHKAIRAALGSRGGSVQVLYGGSVAPSNAKDILALPEVDGVLVGSASLNSDGFWAIAEASR